MAGSTGGAAGSAAAGTGGGAGASAGGSGGTTGSGGATAGAGGGDAGAIACYNGSFGTHTYAFCDALVDWATAQAECERRGMRLARVDDNLENNWIQQTANFSASMMRREGLWLGGFEPTIDGDWHWTDGAAFWSGDSNGMAVGGLFTNWEKGEPNNANGPEACLSMPLNGTTWFDWQCTSAQYFVCEIY